jgi:hypothetical protein
MNRRLASALHPAATENGRACNETAGVIMLDVPIPQRAKVFGWILVLAGSFFAYVYAVMPGAFFPGVALDGYSAEFGLYSTTVRILGSVLGIVIALMLNSAALLALMLATRIFIELGDVMIGLLLNGGPDANTFTLTTLAAVEAYMLWYLVNMIRAQQR